MHASLRYLWLGKGNLGYDPIHQPLYLPSLNKYFSKSNSNLFCTYLHLMCVSQVKQRVHQLFELEVISSKNIFIFVYIPKCI